MTVEAWIQQACAASTGWERARLVAAADRLPKGLTLRCGPGCTHPFTQWGASHAFVEHVSQEPHSPDVIAHNVKAAS